MKSTLFPVFGTLKQYKPADAVRDATAGLVVAALSIPIALGYAQVAGLPAVYGLYGSILPLIAFALLSSSPQLVFGMDAAGSAIMGSVLIGAGIVFQSQEALTMVPLVSLFTGLWLVLFSLLKMGRLASFVSVPVMSGFITGIAVSIMTGQIVQMTGAEFSHGEFTESLMDLIGGITHAHIVPASLLMGAITVATLLLFKQFLPKVPIVLLVMIVAIAAANVFDFASLGVENLGDIPAGLQLPDFVVPTLGQVESALTMSLAVAGVVAIESILGDNHFSQQGGYRIEPNREMAAFGVANLFSALSGASPSSASMSRTAAAEQYGAKTQLSNLFAAVCLILVCLFATPYLSQLPMPVLAGMVFAALCGVVEFDVARRLRRVSRAEYAIFIVVMLSVLLVGIMFGVGMGIALSFLVLLKKVLNPPRYFIGIVPETGVLAPVRADSAAEPISNIVFYRFAGSMFFANCDVVRKDIDGGFRDGMDAVFFDASMISSVDISAGDQMAALVRYYETRGIPFYLIGMSDELKRDLKKYEIGLPPVEKIHVANDVVDALQKSGFVLHAQSGDSDFTPRSHQAWGVDDHLLHSR